MSVSQADKARKLRALHEAPGAFVIPNPWDAGSALMLEAIGFQALATSSGAKAGVLGLARAMALRPNIAFDVRFRPYQLDPGVPREGVDRAAYMIQRFGADAMLKEAHEAISMEGAKEGIEFDWAAIEKRPNTINAHRLIRFRDGIVFSDQPTEQAA